MGSIRSPKCNWHLRTHGEGSRQPQPATWDPELVRVGRWAQPSFARYLEQQADVPRSELSLRRACCESVTAVTAVTECLSDSASRSRRHRPGGASPAPLAPSSGPPRPPSGSHGRAHWEAPTFPLGTCSFPTGRFENPSGNPSGNFPGGESGRVGISKCASKSEWAHGGRGSRRAGWRLARRGGPHRVPLGGASGSRATIGPAPLPVRYLPNRGDFAKKMRFEDTILGPKIFLRRRSAAMGCSAPSAHT